MYNIEIMDDFAGKSENETMRVIPNITDILICLKSLTLWIPSLNLMSVHVEKY